ncbi:Fc.00g110530.m01.CDS01 [Cosmosporella sp. VM-42]
MEDARSGTGTVGASGCVYYQRCFPSDPTRRHCFPTGEERHWMLPASSLIAVANFLPSSHSNEPTSQPRLPYGIRPKFCFQYEHSRIATMPTQRRNPVVKADVGNERSALAVIPTTSDALRHRSTLPAPAKFPLVVVLSFAMSSLGYSLLGEVTKGELAGVSRSQDTWVEVGVLSGWRVIELALGWFAQLDSFDVAALDLLSHGPHLYLLSTFYTLSPTTALSALTIDILSAAVPFYLLRPLSAVHNPSVQLPNRELTTLPLQLYTTALSTGIYTVILTLSLRFVLPRILVLYFSGLPTIEPAYTASYATVLPATVLFGAAASTFIFPVFATTGKTKEDDKIAKFNPVEASLGQTVWWNIWGYTAKTKVAIRRTVVAIIVSAIKTYLSCTLTVYGIEGTGAAAYASVWAFAALCTGVGLGFVGGD